MMKKSLPVLIAISLSACTGDGIYRDVQGSVKSTTPASFNIPGEPTPTITILGRSAEEFQTEFVSTTLNSPIANFIIRNVPKKTPVMFELKHPSFDPVISFPYDLNSTGSVTLPALEAGTVAIIVDQVETVSGATISPTAAMIIGQLSSEGGSNGGCSPISSVVIKNKATGINVSVIGPYYFSSTGQVVDTQNFADTQCSYVMGNVLPGNYILEFLDDTLVKKAEVEVVALEGNVSFGMDVPQ